MEAEVKSSVTRLPQRGRRGVDRQGLRERRFGISPRPQTGLCSAKDVPPCRLRIAKLRRAALGSSILSGILKLTVIDAGSGTMRLCLLKYHFLYRD
jgi:hypothetical protein